MYMYVCCLQNDICFIASHSFEALCGSSKIEIMNAKKMKKAQEKKNSSHKKQVSKVLIAVQNCKVLFYLLLPNYLLRIPIRKVRTQRFTHYDILHLCFL